MCEFCDSYKKPEDWSIEELEKEAGRLREKAFYFRHQADAMMADAHNYLTLAREKRRQLGKA
jgi:hypothetical protein